MIGDALSHQCVSAPGAECVSCGNPHALYGTCDRCRDMYVRVLRDAERNSARTVTEHMRGMIAAKAVELAADWMRANPGRGEPSILIRWPEPGENVFHLFVDEPINPRAIAAMDLVAERTDDERFFPSVCDPV